MRLELKEFSVITLDVTPKTNTIIACNGMIDKAIRPKCLAWLRDEWFFPLVSMQISLPN